MKKQILLSVAAAGMTGLMIMSNAAGPAAGTGGIKNGVKGNANNCGSTSVGCHGGASTATTTGIRVDSIGGVQVNKYVAGMTYTVTVTGGHTSLTKFGFQFAAVSGTGSAQAQAGTFSSLSSQIAEHTNSTIKFIEQSPSAITGPLSKTFKWTAPATGVGDIKMYLTVNAVNGDGIANAADVSDDSVLTLPLYVPPSSVGSVSSNSTVSAFPNPVMGSDLHLQLGSGYQRYNVNVFDVTGRSVYSSEVAPTVSGTATLNTSNWVPGLYKVVVSNENTNEVISVVKQ